jgi:hypothetical protein
MGPSDDRNSIRALLRLFSVLVRIAADQQPQHDQSIVTVVENAEAREADDDDRAA